MPTTGSMLDRGAMNTTWTRTAPGSMIAPVTSKQRLDGFDGFDVAPERGSRRRRRSLRRDLLDADDGSDGGHAGAALSRPAPRTASPSPPPRRAPDDAAEGGDGGDAGRALPRRCVPGGVHDPIDADLS